MRQDQLLSSFETEIYHISDLSINKRDINKLPKIALELSKLCPKKNFVHKKETQKRGTMLPRMSRFDVWACLVW